METIMRLIESLTPLLVAIVAAYGGVIVAKINKLQKDMKTNHGSTSTGNAIDIIHEKIDKLGHKVDHMQGSINELQKQDTSFDSRLGELEDTIPKNRLDLFTGRRRRR